MGFIKNHLNKKDWLITEASYPNNVGFMEMAKFYQIATEEQISEMEEIIKSENWDGFKALIAKTLDVNLQ